jgi:hypothetical protein
MDNMDLNENIQAVFHHTMNKKKTTKFYMRMKEDKNIQDRRMLG